MIPAIEALAAFTIAHKEMNDAIDVARSTVRVLNDTRDIVKLHESMLKMERLRDSLRWAIAIAGKAVQDEEAAHGA